jgi:hypothetical protein
VIRTPFPDDYMSARVWPIAILEPLPGNGRQDVTISDLAIMYIACAPFTDQGGLMTTSVSLYNQATPESGGCSLRLAPLRFPRVA